MFISTRSLGCMLFFAVQVSAKENCLNKAYVEGEIQPLSFEEDPRCPSREYVIKCSGQYLDTNKNGKLERSELQAAIDSLPWYGRGVINVLGSVDKMMKKCDVDGDDAISMNYDMQKNQETCLSSCLKRLAFKKAFFPDCTP